MATEIELKLALPPQAAARLRRHPLLKGRAPTRRALLSLYFDTADYALARRAIALRLRRVGYHWVQTLKAEAENIGAMTRRPEWEVQVTGNRPDVERLPEEARALLAGIDLDALTVCFETEFTRHAWHVEADGDVLELALDRGEVRAAGRREPLSEVEFELKAGAHRHVFEVAGRLLDDLPFTLEPRSKAERGYQLAGATRAKPTRADMPGLARGMDAGAAWRAMLASALAQMIGNVPGAVAGDDPEYLHQLRVAVRRLRTASSLARGLKLDDSLWAEDTRWLMAELSPARDWDVLATQVLPKAMRAWPARAGLDALREAVATRRVEANRRARAALTSARFVRLVLEAEESLAESPVLGQPVEAWAAAVLDRRLRRLRRAAKGFAKLDAAGRHAARIAAKRLRYSADAFAGLHGKRGRSYIDALAKLQDALGLANDRIVAARLLGEFEATPHAYAAGMVEGALAAECGAEQADAARRMRRFLALKTYWPGSA
jgi:inorganic triphosphatase YgiF